MPNNENALMEQNGFIIPETIDGDFTNEDLAEDMAGLRLNFQRIKIPGSGGLQFEIPGDDPENPDYARTLEGVVLFNHPTNAYWPDGGSDEDENETPLCASVDGVQGTGEPGGACAICPLNAFGTGKNGRGKACKNMRHLYLLQNGAYLPVQLVLPPTSLRPWSDFINMIFASRRRGTCGSVIQIGLKRMNNGKDDYSVATFKKLYDFTGEELAQIKLYADGFRSQIKAMLLQRAADAESRPDSLMEIDGEGYTDAYGETDGRFSVSSRGCIDGEREALPA